MIADQVPDLLERGGSPGGRLGRRIVCISSVRASSPVASGSRKGILAQTAENMQ